MENYTKKDFLSAPSRGSRNSDVGEFDSLVIIPTRRKHDSGFMCMDFVALLDGEIVCRLSGCSDVIHIDGIAGLGEERDYTTQMVKSKGCCIDLLPCGYFRLFASNGRKLICGPALSSFEILSS